MDSKTIHVFRDPNERDTPGILTHEGQMVCFTLEDLDRGLTSEMPLKEIREKKVYGDTAIPYGVYDLKWYDSPKFGRVPLLKGVKGFTYILIHQGNHTGHTSGCLLVGMVKDEGKLIRSAEAFQKLKRLIIDNEINRIVIEKMK